MTVHARLIALETDIGLDDIYAGGVKAFLIGGGNALLKVVHAKPIPTWKPTLPLPRDPPMYT